MCGPAAGVMLGIVGAMKAVTEYGAEVQDFNSSEEQWQTNYKNALAAGRDEDKALTTKAVQEASASGQQDTLYAEEGAVKASEAEAASAGAGVGGGSADEVVRSVLAGAAQNRYFTQKNADWEAAQITAERTAAVDQTENRITSLTRPNAPNPAKLFLGVAGAFLGALPK